MSRKDFNEFKKHFKYYINKFGLSDYEPFYKQDDCDNNFAQIRYDCYGRTATIHYNDKHKNNNTKKSAKHEAIHLMLADAESIACNRFCTGDEVHKEFEALCVKLTELIP